MQKRWFCLVIMTILLQVGFNANAASASSPDSKALSISANHSNTSTPQPVPQLIAKSMQHRQLEHLATPLSAPLKSLNFANKGASQTEQESAKALKDKANRSILSYEEAITNLESIGGSYNGDIEQQLMSLGLAQQFLGKHQKAIKIYKRAMHLNRINEGLYSTGQVQIIERLINSHMAMAQWEEVSDRYKYLYWLGQQNYGGNDIRMLPTLHQLSRWHLQAYAMRIGDDQSTIIGHLVEAHKMFERSIALLAHQYGENDQRLINELNGLTLANYFFATFQNMPIKKRTSTPVSDLDMRRSGQMINQFISNSFRRGKESISRVIEIHQNDENATPWAVAKAKVKLADWMLMFNKRNSAISLYQEAFNALDGEETSIHERGKIFGHPVALPRLDLLENNTYSENDGRAYDKQKDYVLASFDVTAHGKTTNIEILESQPTDNISVRSQVKKSLRVARFRPRFIEGQPVFAENVTLRILSPQ
ncbi:MAG: tetratricopeptide (TPR) repeat protein [Phenylobacterium sp.]|jgi:tetratricopeptide (TPR) repeat protein